MIYTAIDTFYLSEEDLKNTPSRRDGVEESIETTLRIYGCDLIQESGILLRLPQAVMATGQVLFHRFYCKKSFVRFNVKRVASSCVWLASKLEESPRKARQVIFVFHRMECRRESLPIEYLDPFSKKYSELKSYLIRTERHLLKEMGFICHVEHPHKFISNYLATLEAPPELTQEAWNLTNDSLRTTLCVRFKSEVVACGVVYAAARRFQIPLPENPPWWKSFDADKSAIDEICEVLAHLYSLPKARYIPLCRDGDALTLSNKTWDAQSHPLSKEDPGLSTVSDTKTPKPLSIPINPESGVAKDACIKMALGKLKKSMKSDEDDDDDDEDFKSVSVEVEARELGVSKSRSDHKHREREREKERERDKGREHRDKERERDESDKVREKGHRSKSRGKDSGGQLEKRHHSSRDRDYYGSYTSREKERHKHHS